MSWVPGDPHQVGRFYARLELCVRVVFGIVSQ